MTTWATHPLGSAFAGDDLTGAASRDGDEAFMRFLPMMLIYVPIHIASGLPVNANLLWVVPIVALFLLLATGLAMLVAAGQVYFRDLSNFLPYMLRIWLYISPVLYFAENVPHDYTWLLKVNPLAGLLTARAKATAGS